MARVRTSPYAVLLEDDNTRRWYENLGKGSGITASVYRRRLGFFCNHYKMKPKDLASLGPREVEEKLQDFLSELEKRGRAGSYIEGYKKAVRSWCEWNSIFLQRKIRVRDANRHRTTENEVVPTQEELKRVLSSDKTPLRTRCSIALMAFSGLRFQSQANEDGSDGLAVGDLPELEIAAEKRVAFSKIPAQVTVRPNLNKARHKYITFMNEEGCRLLEELLNRRAGNGEKITATTPIIATSKFYDTRGRPGTKPAAERVKFMSSIKLRDAIRVALRELGFKWRPYVLRSYFDTALMLAESKGKVSHAYQAFWMGHKGDIEATYTTKKSRLPDEVLQDMREAYQRCQPFISTEKQQSTAGENLKEALKREILLNVAGYKKEEVDKLDLSTIKDEDFQKMVRERLLGAMANNGNKQKVVPVGQVSDLISKGWEYVTQLPTGEAIVKLPI